MLYDGKYCNSMKLSHNLSVIEIYSLVFKLSSQFSFLNLSLFWNGILLARIILHKLLIIFCNCNLLIL